jgi:hypothetical protein
LADWDLGFRRELAKVLEKQRLLANTADMVTQWNRLIVEPMRHFQIIGPVVIVIDALDECDHAMTRPRRLLPFLTKHLTDLLPNVRFTVTTRPEQDVIDAIHNNPEVDGFNLDSYPDEASGDIYQYFRSRFSEVDHRRGALTDPDFQLLVQKSEGLFQWSFTSCEVMLAPGPAGLTLKERFDDFMESLGHNGLHPLDSLYAGILLRLFQDETPIIDRFRSVMAQVMSACEPLSINTLHEIRRHAHGVHPRRDQPYSSEHGLSSHRC